MSEFLFIVYRFFVFPISFLLVQIFKPFLNSKIQAVIQQKNQEQFQIQSQFKNWLNLDSCQNSKPFWIHASSGEIEYAKPVITELKSLFPQRPIIVTYSSPSALFFFNQLPHVDAWGPLPWDSPHFLKAFLKKWNPQILLVSRTDLWPEMAEQCRVHNIPILLFSATFAENSSRLNGFSKYLTKRSLEICDQVFCVDNKDVMILQKKLNLNFSLATGDTRFDQAFERLKTPKQLNLSIKPSPNDFVFIMGSTWPEDENILLPFLKKLNLINNYSIKRLKFILAPHEVDESHLEKIKERCEELNIKLQTYSSASEWNSGEILLIDRMGLLAELYTWASIAFVGGSFKKQVHSVMEPLVAGIPVLIGPYHENNREADQFKNIKVGSQKMSAVTVVENMKDLENYFHETNFENMEKVRDDIHNQIVKRLGATQRVVDWVKTQI